MQDVLMPKICTQCGAPLKMRENGFICEYCGTMYESVFGPTEYKIVKLDSPAKVYKMGIMRDSLECLMVPENILINQIKREFAMGIAKAIADEIEIEHDSDRVDGKELFYAKIRVLGNNYKF